MPLKPGSSQKVISSNIHELTHHGSRPRPHDQIVAIALHNADKSKRADGGMVKRGGGGFLDDLLNGLGMEIPGVSTGSTMGDTLRTLRMGLFSDGGEVVREQGGMVPIHAAAGSAIPEAPWYTRAELRDSTQGEQGFLHGSTPGRADAIKTSAPSGSYVIPADVVSGLGQGNSMAGAKALDNKFNGGPWGTSLPRAGRGAGAPRPPSPLKKLAKGGDAGSGPIPVMLSHGEYVIKPEVVAAIGDGNAKSGFKILDHFVLEMRKRTIDKMKKLPGPAK